MPTLPLPLCKYSLCTERVRERGKGYCLKHQRVIYKEESKFKSDPFYWSKAWRTTKEAYKKEHPWCVTCESKGKMRAVHTVDHIVPRELGGADHAEDNLQSLCEECHAKKRAQERGGNRGGA